MAVDVASGGSEGTDWLRGGMLLVMTFLFVKLKKLLCWAALRKCATGKF